MEQSNGTLGIDAPLEQCLDICADAVLDAWTRVRHYHRGEFTVFEKAEGPATEADREADRAITGALLARFPREAGYAYLTEEYEDDEDRLDARRVWVVDPIDGTKYFIRGEDDFAMMAGLLEGRGAACRPVLGVVYAPVADLLYTAIAGGGAFVHRRTADSGPWRVQFSESERLRVGPESDPARCRGVFSGSGRRNPSPRLLESLERIRPAERRHMGSLGLKIMEVASNRADFYLNPELGKTMEWDLAGPAAILAEAGGKSTDLRGDPILFNQPEPRLRGGIIASNGACADAIKALMAREPRLAGDRLRPAGD